VANQRVTRRDPGIGRLLRACTREHDWERPLRADRLGPLPSNVGRIARQARLHGVEACVYLTLRFEDRLDDRVRDELEAAYHSALQVHVRAEHDLGVAGVALDHAGVEWATFKGPVLAEHVYRRHDLRSYSDLDLLVHPTRLRDAVTAIEAGGGVVLERNWRLVRERMNGEIHVRLPAGTIADLHWNLFNRVERRDAFPISTDDVLSRAVVVDLDGSRARTLSDEDTLVHLALHACMSGGTQLLWCKDLEQAVIRRPVNWDVVVDRALEWHAGPPTALMLATASRTLDFPVPDDVVRRLSPGPLWRGLARATGHWAPPEEWSGGRSLLRDVCLSSRADDRAGAIALARRIGSLIKKRDLGAPHLPDRDPSHPTSLLHPSNDPRDRAAYFAALETGPDAR
jgi:hypothetical protein